MKKSPLATVKARFGEDKKAAKAKRIAVAQVEGED